MQRRSQPPWLHTLATLFVSVWALCLGCNPSLVSAVGGDSVNATDTPDGYIMILVMNSTTSSVNTQIDIIKQNGTLSRKTLSVGPLLFFTSANDCDVQSIQVVNFGYSSPGGVVTTPSNLGAISMGQGIDCGKVLAITASGTPPVFSVQVY
jgi:hypothetical protein